MTPLVSHPRHYPRRLLALITFCLALTASLGTDQAWAGFSFKKGSFTKSTNTSVPVNQSVTGVGFQPKALVFFWTAQTSAGAAAEVSTGVGMCTSSSNERAIAVAADDDVSLGDAVSRQSQSSCIIILNPDTPLFRAEAALASLDSDGFTLTWTTNDSVGTLIHYIALGGSDLTNATASSFTLASGTGSQSITGLGFQPDFLIFASIDDSPMDQTDTAKASLSLGFASSASAEGSIAVSLTPTDNAISDSQVRQRTDSALNEVGPNGADDLLADVTSFDSDGFTINKSTNADTTVVHFLALKGGQYKVGSFNKDTSTSVPFDQSVTGIGFRPVGLLFAANGLSSSTTIQQEGRLSLSGTDGPPATNQAASEEGIWIHDADALTRTDANMRTSTTKVGTLATQSTLVSEADTKSFDSGGFTLTWTTNIVGNIASEILYVAFGHTSTSAVTLARVEAVDQGGLVQLRWRTAEEINNLGFHVYREGPDGVRLRLTPELITGSAPLAGPGHALTAGRRYRFWDDLRAVNTGLSPQHSILSPVVRYWLEDVDLNGTRTRHGPIFPSVKRETSHVKREDEEAPPATLHASRATLHAASAVSGGTPQAPRTAALPIPTIEGLARQAALLRRRAIKLSVNREGWYRVGRDELLAHGVGPNVDPRTLRLLVDGQELPLLVTGEADGRLDPGGAIEFYGLGLDTPSTDTRVYWLTWGGERGLRVSVREASLVKRDIERGQSPALEGLRRATVPSQHSALGPQHFPFTVDLAPKTLYVAAIKNGEADNFFGGVVTLGGADYPVTLTSVVPEGAASVAVTLQGFTEQPHAVTVSVNGAIVGALSWTGQTVHARRVTLHAGLLHDGANTVRLQATGDETDVSLVAALRLTYARAATAEQDQLRITADGGQTIQLGGFHHPQILVVDVTEADRPARLRTRVIRNRDGTYAVRAEVPAGGRRTLYAVSRLAYRPVAGLAAWGSDHLPAIRGADLVIITPTAWRPELQPLAHLRRSQGLRVQIVTLEALYERFSFGHKDPSALKRFLTQTPARSLGRASALSPQSSGPFHASRLTPRGPRYALLVGDASVDPRNYLGQGAADIVPTKLLDTAALETAGDDWFGDADDDGIPEVVVGRLPARTLAELRRMIGKLVGAAPVGETLLVSDDPDVYDFPAASARLRAQLPAGQAVSELTVDPAHPETTKATLLEKLNQGPGLVHYLGHGSVGIWAGEGILTSEDAQALTNASRLPIVLALNCLNSFFHDVYSESLAEAFLRAPQGGAQAVWASSGMTTPGQQVGLDAGFFHRHAVRGARLGDLIRAAKAAVSDPDVRRTWNLLGDPTTRLPYAE
jgi:hypothetical protein